MCFNLGVGRSVSLFGAVMFAKRNKCGICVRTPYWYLMYTTWRICLSHFAYTNILFQIYFQMIMFWGCVDASASTAKYNLKRGRSLLIFIGGEKVSHWNLKFWAPRSLTLNIFAHTVKLFILMIYRRSNYWRVPVIIKSCCCRGKGS